jgi:HAE1 family hydrophobic/amphiphilic exporter-1
MGWAIIGGLVSSTLLTLIVVPAAYTYIDRFRVWSLNLMKRIFVARDPNEAVHAVGAGPSSGEAVPGAASDKEA